MWVAVRSRGRRRRFTFYYYSGKPAVFLNHRKWKIHDVVVVPFPFTDQKSDKRRPALVLSEHDSFNDIMESCVLAMITSAKNPDWPFDTPLGSIRKAGLPAPSKVRMKLFTLDSRLIAKKIGGLSAKDQKAVTINLKKLMVLADSRDLNFLVHGVGLTPGVTSSCLPLAYPMCNPCHRFNLLPMLSGCTPQPFPVEG